MSKFPALPIPIQKLSRKTLLQLQKGPIKQTKYQKRGKTHQINQSLHKMGKKLKTASTKFVQKTNTTYQSQTIIKIPRLIQINCAINAWSIIRKRHSACIANKYTLTQVMMVKNGFCVINVEDGFIVNAPITNHHSILILNA